MRAVVCITRSTITCVGAGLKEPIAAPIPDTIFRDLEVVDHEGFSEFFDAFIKKHKIPTAQIALLIDARLCFQEPLKMPEEKDAPPLDEEAFMHEFLENVPLQHPIAKIYTHGAEKTIIATNQTIIKLLQEVCIANGFSMVAALPLHLAAPEVRGDITPQQAEGVLRKFGGLGALSFPLEEKQKDSSEEDMFARQNLPHPPQKNNRLFVLVGIFIILIGILIIVYLLMGRSSAGSKTAARTSYEPALSPALSPAPPTPTATPTQIPEPSVPRDEIRLEIRNASGIPGLADRVRADLREAQFTDAVTGNAPLQLDRPSTVIFSSRVPIQYQREITEILRTRYPNIVVRGNDEIQRDILITLSQESSRSASPEATRGPTP